MRRALALFFLPILLGARSQPPSAVLNCTGNLWAWTGGSKHVQLNKQGEGFTTTPLQTGSLVFGLVATKPAFTVYPWLGIDKSAERAKNAGALKFSYSGDGQTWFLVQAEGRPRQLQGWLRCEIDNSLIHNLIHK